MTVCVSESSLQSVNLTTNAATLKQEVRVRGAVRGAEAEAEAEGWRLKAASAPRTAAHPPGDDATF